MQIKNNNLGITLIALVVTIIVLLILSGITIGILNGDNNIIKNAIIHGNGNARIKYSIKDNSVEFECGNGIINPREIDISQVFDRFYKSDAARGRGSTGLGLPVAKELSDRMGGKISASIEENMFVIKFVMYTRPDVRKT